jgi:hypothetical protein
MKNPSALSVLPAAVSVSIFLAVLTVLAATASAQASTGTVLGTSLGGTAFDLTSDILLRAMKTPGATAGMGPRKLDFSDVGVNKSALNVMEITNGTNSKIEIESLSVPSSGFRVASKLTLPLTVPPQTQAVLEVEFHPTRPGDYGGEVQVSYRPNGGGKSRKMEIALKGKGVQE